MRRRASRSWSCLVTQPARTGMLLFTPFCSFCSPPWCFAFYVGTGLSAFCTWV
jgi:hypothetical protein